MDYLAKGNDAPTSTSKSPTNRVALSDSNKQHPVEIGIQDASLADDGDVVASRRTPLSISRTPNDIDRESDTTVKKSKRVRTGCLTCRERHLKCDETLHRCQNCRKSDRVCRWGIRLNFIDTQIVAPPHYITRPPGSAVSFQDDSRRIASEYVGGIEKYSSPKLQIALESDSFRNIQTYSQLGITPAISNALRPREPLARSLNGPTNSSVPIALNSYPVDERYPPSSFKSANYGSNRNNYLKDPDQIQLMRVFIDNVGPWMDALNGVKYFTQEIPLYALEEPMLLNACFACGAASPGDPLYGREKGLYFYNVSTHVLLETLQDPQHDPTLCATTAIILDIYEMMSSMSFHSMHHARKCRALIEEYRWDSRTRGLGGACFWLNIVLELLGCLQVGWQLTCDPDTWGVDLNFGEPASYIAGNEETWIHRIIFLCSKVSNLRSTLAKMQELREDASESVINESYQEWTKCANWCDQWIAAIPRSMMPVTYLPSWQSSSKSPFPQIWLITHCATIAQLFYHVTRILLTKTNPIESEFTPKMQHLRECHAFDICGIVANIRDRGIATLSVRFLAIAAECLTTKEAQQEVLETLDKLKKEIGWRVDQIKHELQRIWGWEDFPREDQLVPAPFDSTSLLDDGQFLDSEEDYTQTGLEVGDINHPVVFSDFTTENHSHQDY